MSITEVNPVDQYSFAIKEALTKARQSKPLGEIDPPLASQYLEECIENLVTSTRNDGQDKSDVKPNYAAIETACRDIFYGLLALHDIGEAAFGELWSLLDIVSSLSDCELCEPSLIFWLVEELLDSQTIDGCRVVFDYLDSRRERLIAQHFKEKSLVILRTCNELLRRLSRAEDTVFCGRVFIFLFQSFPLGDKSSVNLRGEFHTENVTTYEKLLPKEGNDAEDGMDVDQDEAAKKVVESTTGNNTPSSGQVATESQQTGSSTKTVKAPDLKKKPEEPEPNMDVLYETFWALQEFFSQPTKLFDEINLETLKAGVKATMRKFKAVQKGLQSRGMTKAADEGKRGSKRKRSSQEDEVSTAFNPKYLTSRDLFDLEIKDLAFRRHIMVQTLIILDFLLSLTPKSKKKLEHLNNRAVLYTYTLSDENTKWATDAKLEVAEYLIQGPEGKFYYRMVETVLSRDKNWLHWKAESCPPITIAPVPAEDFSQAIKGVQRTCANKRLKANPMGALDLKFLSETVTDDTLSNLKNPERYAIPTLESFEQPIADDQFEIDMPTSDESKQLAEDAKASKLWRTLRLASKKSLKVFDKYDDGKNLDALFRPHEQESSQKSESHGNERKGSNGSEPLSKSEQKVQKAEGEAIETVKGMGGKGLDGAADEIGGESTEVQKPESSGVVAEEKTVQEVEPTTKTGEQSLGEPVKAATEDVIS